MKIDLFRRVINKWGVAAQVTMAMEECAELIVVLNQYFFRSRGCLRDVASEIADVEIMCLQLREMVNDDDLVNTIKKSKIDRLEKRLNDK